LNIKKARWKSDIIDVAEDAGNNRAKSRNNNVIKLLVRWISYGVRYGCLCVGSRAVRLAFSEVSRRLFFTDWERGSINVIDVQQSDTTPQPLITGLNNPLPITTHPQHRYYTQLVS